MYSLLVLSALFLIAHSAQVDHSREYQMELIRDQFWPSRSVGIANYLNYLKTYQNDPTLQFTIDVNSGYEEIVHEVRYDTAGSDLLKSSILIKVQNTQTGPDAG